MRLGCATLRKMPRPVLLLSLMLDQGGSERQLTEMALALDRNRYQPHVGTFRAWGMRAEELRAAGVPVLDLAVRSFRSMGALRAAWMLRGYIRKQGIELVHAFDAPLTVFSTPVTRYLTRAAMVSSQRGHRALTPEFRRLLRFTDSRVDAIVVNCDYLKRHLTEDEAVAERRIEVCFNGVNLARFPATVPQRPAALAGARTVIGTLCALRPEKGLLILLEAFARLDPQKQGLKLAVVGSGLQRETLIQCAHQLGIAGECIFEPATADIAPWLKAMDIFVMPSYEEAFSNALMEAMACRCAVVATNVGGNPELVDASRGLLVPPGEPDAMAGALQQLVADTTMREQVADAGNRFVRENLARERAASRLADIYDRVLSNRRR